MMKAIVHAGEGGLKGLNYKEIMDKRPGIGEVKVRLKAARAEPQGLVYHG